MERITRFRAVILILLVCSILGFFAFRLYDEQIIKTGGVIDNTTTFTTMTVVKAARGDILDCNGNLLVSNRASYDLVINHLVLTSSKNPNDSLYRLVQLCKERNIQYADHLPISEGRPFTYTLDEFNSAWQNYFKDFLSERGSWDSDITAPLLIQLLRESYKIPEEWSDEDARAVLGLRYEMSLRTIINLPNYVFMEDVSDEDLALIVELNIPGMNVEASTVREYNTTYAAHLLGYVGAMSPAQWEYYKTLEGYNMDARVGQAGLELAFEEELHGIDGVRIDTVTTDGTIVKSVWQDGQAPKAGNNVEVTIDLNLQMVAEESLAKVLENLRAQENEKADGIDAEGGAVVVMEVETGKVLVSASYPSYDPATFFENYNDLLEDPLLPLNNRALNFAYPPGSTYKPIMTIAAIDHHVAQDGSRFTSATPFVTDGIFDKYATVESGTGFTGYCLAWPGNHGEITLIEALSVSCNDVFFTIADVVLISESDPVAKAFGLGEPTGIELIENVGYRCNEETKKRLYDGVDETFYTADRLQNGIGQADNRFSPLQLCVYAATLANRGTRYKATLMSRVVSSDYRTLVAEQKREIMSTFEISDDAYYAYSEGMKKVASEGTGRRTFATYPIQIAAKTGTAETGMGFGSDNAAFICYAPARNPKVAIAVYCEKAGHGSTVAGIAKDILDVYFDVDEISDVAVRENAIS